MDEMRAVLDSLMGKDRDSSLAEKKTLKKMSYRDSEVCKFYLMDFCPHDLFPNTKRDLGPCKRVHSDGLKEQFLICADKDKYLEEYESDFTAFLQQLVDQVEQKIRKGNERIVMPLPSDNVNATTGGENGSEEFTAEQKSRVDSLNVRITGLMENAQTAGEKGDVQTAEDLTAQITALRRETEKIRREVSGSPFDAFVHKEKQLRVCAVCGAMQSLGDSMSRFESHIAGKQHQGFEKIRTTLELLHAKRKKRITTTYDGDDNDAICDSQTIGQTTTKDKSNSAADKTAPTSRPSSLERTSGKAIQSGPTTTSSTRISPRETDLSVSRDESTERPTRKRRRSVDDENQTSEISVKANNHGITNSDFVGSEDKGSNSGNSRGRSRSAKRARGEKSDSRHEENEDVNDKHSRGREHKDSRNDDQRNNKRDNYKDNGTEDYKDSRSDDFRDNKRDDYKDSRRDDYRDNRRDDYRGGRRDDYRDSKRDDYKDSRRDDYRDNRKDDYRGGRRDDYRDSKRDDYKDSRRDDYRDNRKDDYRDNRKDDYRDTRRDDYRDNRRDDYRGGRRDDYRGGRRDDYRDSRRDENRGGRRDEYKGNRGDSRRDDNCGYRRNDNRNRDDYRDQKDDFCRDRRRGYNDKKDGYIDSGRNGSITYRDTKDITESRSRIRDCRFDNSGSETGGRDDCVEKNRRRGRRSSERGDDGSDHSNRKGKEEVETEEEGAVGKDDDDTDNGLIDDVEIEASENVGEGV